MNVIHFPTAADGRIALLDDRHGAFFDLANLPRSPQADGLPAPADVLRLAIAMNSPRRVILAALAALVRPRARPPDLRHLPPYLRKDIGLGPTRPPLPSERSLY